MQDSERSNELRKQRMATTSAGVGQAAQQESQVSADQLLKHHGAKLLACLSNIIGKSMLPALSFLPSSHTCLLGRLSVALMRC